MVTTFASIFTTIFDRDYLLELGRRFEAIQRLREIHPADFFRALAESSMGEEKRTIGTARRQFGEISGFSPEESAFYRRFNPGMVKLISHQLKIAMENAPRTFRPLLRQLLEQAGIADMLAIDSSRFSMPSWTKELFRSTDDNLGGVKVTAMLSLLSPMITKLIVTNARIHDRKALKVARWLHGQLLLMDRGYCDRKLFAQIEDRRGYFIIRFKKNNHPKIVEIRSGLDQSYLGQTFRGDLPLSDKVDLDISFKMADGSYRKFRLVRLTVGSQQMKKGEEVVSVLFVTNLSPEQFTVEQLATLYRFRWEIERLFAIAKGICKLDHLQSGNKEVVECFVYSTLLAVVLGLRLCEWMKRKRPSCEPSAWRVTCLIMMWLSEIVRKMGRSDFCLIIADFENALFREGTNPNPGRPYTSTRYTLMLGWQDACKGQTVTC